MVLPLALWSCLLSTVLAVLATDADRARGLSVYLVLLLLLLGWLF